MISAPSPPNRRRRRIIVAIAVLVLGLGWWFWPRGDARFVGKWQVKGSQAALELFRDGLGREVSQNFSNDLIWAIEDDTLLLTIAPYSGFRKHPSAALRRLFASGGTPPTRYRFIIRSRDEISLLGTGRAGPFEMTLVRAPE